MSAEIDDLWAQIVEVHNEAKTLFLLGEELDHEQFLDFIQPINEHRHSLEHIIRAKADELGLTDGSAPDYQRNCLEKSLGHEYRAFFDCADWISIILREDITRMLKAFSVECIKDIIPDYYPKFRPRITKISETIAELRGSKDIAKSGCISGGVQAYKALLDELRNIHQTIESAQDSLLDYRKRTRSSNRTKWISGIIASVLVAVIIAVGSFLIGKAITTPAGTSTQNDSFQRDQK